MTLKVIRYKNYGCQITSEDDEGQFYFSFYELSNLHPNYLEKKYLRLIQPIDIVKIEL